MSETLWTLESEEEVVLEDTRDTPSDAEATVETAKMALSTSEDKDDSLSSELPCPPE